MRRKGGLVLKGRQVFVSRAKNGVNREFKRAFSYVTEWERSHD